MTVRKWADLTTTDFAALDRARTIAVLPVGAVEQHGPHLPLSTDTDLAEGVLARIADRVDPALTVLILPTQALGRSLEHEGFAGTLSLSAETVLALWKDIGRSVAASGIRKLVFFNGHGGNVSVMEIVARDLRAAHGLLTAYTSWFSLNGQEGLFSADEIRHGIHGGAVETAAMLALDPSLVRQDKVADFPSQGRDWGDRFQKLGVGGTPVRLGWLMRDLNPEGAAGDATAGSAAIGEILLDAAAEGFAEFLREFDALPVPD